MSVRPINPRRSSATRRGLSWRITIRLSDAGMRRRQTEPIYPDHRPSPWFTEGAPRDRSNRLLCDSGETAHLRSVTNTPDSVSHPKPLCTKVACQGLQCLEAGTSHIISRSSVEANQASFVKGSASLPRSRLKTCRNIAASTGASESLCHVTALSRSSVRHARGGRTTAHALTSTVATTMNLSCITMRLSDSGLRCRETKLLYQDHRLPPWLTEAAPRDRSNRLLGCRQRRRQI
jgi:hypothetical protein